MDNNTLKTEIATLAGGCFWCTEAIFRRLKGVISVTSGYSGGKTVNPSYEDVVSGTTDHAEAIQIEFNPDIISYQQILDVFWKTHDPTTLNRQGADAGTQYRSIIFYHNEQQKRVAEISKDDMDKEQIYKNPAVTEIVPFTVFYPAEKYHQDFYTQNKKQGYCQLVIDPKIKKLEKEFEDMVKK